MKQNHTEVHKVLCTVCTERNNEVGRCRGGQETVIVFFWQVLREGPIKKVTLKT